MDQPRYIHCAINQLGRNRLDEAELAAKSNAKNIVFCGVHFMAESADILTSDEQRVILPNMRAGCSMADMANVPDVEECWHILLEELDLQDPLLRENPDEIAKALGLTSGADLHSFESIHKAIKSMTS